MEAEDFVASLRKLADLYEAHPDLPAPADLNVLVYCGADTPDEQRRNMARIARTLRHALKEYDDYFNLTYPLGDGMKLQFYVPRETVCRRVVVGKRTIPAQAAQPEREVEEVEWVCDEAALLNGD